jgi:glycosyltransferase involved in cell wall biosynthesis
MIFTRNAWISALLIVCGMSLIFTTPRHYNVIEPNVEERDGTRKIKKVAIILNLDDSGVATHYLNLKARLDKIGIQVDIVGNLPSDFLQNTFCAPQACEATLRFSPINTYISSTLQYDAVHIADSQRLSSRVAASGYYIYNIPYTTSVHTSQKLFQDNLPPLLQLLPIQFNLSVQACRNAAKIFPAAEWLARDIHRDFAFDADKIAVKSNGFDPCIFNMNRGDEYNALHNYLENDLKLPKPWNFCISRISPEKNLPEFFKMDIPGSKIMVGRGPLLDQYKREYPNVTFLGHKTGRELAACYQNADACVYTSFSEVLPCVPIESIACGTPIATFDANGFSDVVINDVNGYLVDPAHPEDFPVAIAKVMQLDRTKVAASVHNNPKYDWNEIANVFYDNLVYIPQSVRERARAKLQYENSVAGRIDNAISWMMWINPIMWPLGIMIYCAQSNSYN